MAKMIQARSDIRELERCWVRFGLTLLKGKWAVIDTGGGEKPAPRGWFDADVALDRGQEAIW